MEINLVIGIHQNINNSSNMLIKY